MRHAEPVPLSPLVERCVTPFYLRMMRLNAMKYGLALFDDIAAVGQSVTADDVVTLLRSAWRERVMGAWLATIYDEPLVQTAVLQSLESSAGSLTSPPLATVGVLLCGPESLDSLRRYRIADLANKWGAVGFIDAAIEYLGESPSPDSDESHLRPEDRSNLASLLAVAERLRAA
jgi:hypothetical protein